ncbi:MULTISPECIES: hypothetical protein [unclassified Sporosarcina]|uniref:hypothetical protein n=1 Tax=unclassified Sporosarcina TaxID=2647733 RepID=UPI00203D55BD|nr:MULTISPECIES: hypothetical protein [unclassified Sporosarcina]GKV64340.1 hypothetical protein NCCP2331_04930 [Sporosarcina sp. NCCP-2331]GLB55085.1 hypothetical protein NCCP2378_08710 [Sporosarcina sp. NCCP-2378]
MKMRPFWVIMTIILISWAANFAYAESKKLAHPIFVDHYIDVWWEQNPYFSIYYLANKEGRSTIQSVELGDWQGAPEHFGTDPEFEEVDQYGRYSLRRVTLQMNQPPAVTEAQKFREITVNFTDGSTVQTEIGQITVLRPEFGAQPFTDQSSASGEYEKTQLLPGEDVTIESVKTSFDDVLQNQFFIKLYMREHSLDQGAMPEGMSEYEEKSWQNVPGIDVRTAQFPFDMEKGERLTITSAADLKLRGVLQMDIEVAGKTAANEPFTTIASYISYPQFTGEEIKQLIKKRTEAKSIE